LLVATARPCVVCVLLLPPLLSKRVLGVAVARLLQVLLLEVEGLVERLALILQVQGRGRLFWLA
jgi:hypothetical protein